MPAAPLARPKDIAQELGSRLRVIVPLGLTQTLAWASSYYLLAILANPIARDTAMPSTAVFAAFSGALLISAAIGPRVGRTIGNFGGRLVLVVSTTRSNRGFELSARALIDPAHVGLDANQQRKEFADENPGEVAGCQ